MLLAIDCGNTNTVFAIVSKGKIDHLWRINTNINRTADEYAVWLLKLLEIENLNFKDIANIIIASVVPESMFTLKTFCEKHVCKDVMVIGEKFVNLGIDVNIDNPNEAGADRLVNAVAINKFYRTPAIVIDFGTATTFDVVGEKGSYEGGLIAPGVNLSLEALYMAASRLPRISISPLKKEDSIIGKNTKSSMLFGIYWGYISMVEGIVKRLTIEKKLNFFVLATGGLATLFSENCNVIKSVDENLTLKGLIHIYNINKSLKDIS